MLLRIKSRYLKRTTRWEWVSGNNVLQYNIQGRPQAHFTYLIPVTFCALESLKRYPGTIQSMISHSGSFIIPERILTGALRYSAMEGNGIVSLELIGMGGLCEKDYADICPIDHALRNSTPIIATEMLKVTPLSQLKSDLTRLLEQASIRGYTEFIQEVLKVPREITGHPVGNAVVYAAMYGYVGIVELLLDSVTPAFKESAEFQENLDIALEHAAVRGHPDVVRLLLSAGAKTSHISNKQLRCIRFVYKHHTVSELLAQAGREITGRRLRKACNKKSNKGKSTV